MVVLNLRSSLMAALLIGCASCQADLAQSSSAVAATSPQELQVSSAAVCSFVGPSAKTATPSVREDAVFPKLGPGLGNRMKEVGKQQPPPDQSSAKPPDWVGKKQEEFLGAAAAAEPAWSKLAPAEKQAARAALKEQMLLGVSP